MKCGLGTVKFLKFGRRHLQRCDPNEKSGCSSTRRWELAVFIVFGMGYFKPLKVEKLLKTWAKR